jgi:hypothetical protein
MTILCLVRNPKDGSWAAFSDCLITTDEFDSGASLVTPIRVNIREAGTVGFAECALEEKLGFLEPGLVLGWAGNRQEAISVANALRSRQSDNEIQQIFEQTSNCYFIAQCGILGQEYIAMVGPNIEKIESNGYEFYCAGSGARILKGLRFTGRLRPLAEGAIDVVAALLSAVSRFMSEEMAGQTSQFYSLRTGGHYQILCGIPGSVRRIHYCVNHWRQGENEPLVMRISLPLEANGYQTFISFDVGRNWELDVSTAIALAPLLQSPRTVGKIEIRPLEALVSKIAYCTFHTCWLKDSHQSFVVNLREPFFELVDDAVRLDAYNPRTIAMVKQLLAE